ncbi:hypothetical protein AB1Y20_006063 [Prymnesium parvum]|uniref:peptidyl-tRNA hydrolase n=1 Tax=Prymnesium parvum TaxID=97485 RepID=A0AB34J1K1_PRYPA
MDEDEQLARAIALSLGASPEPLGLLANPHGDARQMYEQTKMVCLVREDLGMGTGKIAAQVAHGALGAYRRCAERSPHNLVAWEMGGEACIVLRVRSRTELDQLLVDADAKGLTTYAVHDAGRTQVEAGTQTVGCIGPGPVRIIDTVTGHLQLYN